MTRDIIRVATPDAMRRAKQRKAIIAEVAAIHGLAPEDLTQPSHIIGSARPHKAQARWHAMARLRNEHRLSLPAIGRLFGGRDHSSVLHGIARWQEIERQERGA